MALEALLYFGYAFLNALAMTLVKRALQVLRGRRFGAAFPIASAAVVLYFAGLGALVALLRMSDASVVLPVGVGCTVLATSLLARTVLRETLSKTRILGTGFVVAGVALVLFSG